MKQKSLLDFISEEYTCKYCNRNVEVVEVDNNHIQLNVKMRKTLFQDLMKTVERSGVDLCRLLSEAFIMGDILFDKEVRKYAAQKNWKRIQPFLQTHDRSMIV